jgi:hypothetical protein
MAFLFDATEGGTTSNSYCTVEFADDYFGGELYAAEWNALVNTNPPDLLKKEQALCKATRRLERLQWVSLPTHVTQALKHPRFWLEDDHGYFYPQENVIPPVKFACCELALFYLRQDPTLVVDQALRQFKSLHVANVLEFEMREQLPNEDDLPPRVLNFIAPWLTAGPGGVRIVRA